MLSDCEGRSIFHPTDEASQVAPPDVDSVSVIPQHLLGSECEMPSSETRILTVGPWCLEHCVER